MSILPVLGHKPITSYFSRTSSAKRKRKEVDKDAEGFSKKPRQSSKLANTNSGQEKVEFPCTPPVSYPRKQNLEAQSCQGDELEDISPSPRLSIRAGHQPFGMPASFLASNTPTMPGFLIPSSQSQESPSMEVDTLTPLISRNIRRPIGEDIIIESSQSQLLIMASPNIQKLKLEPTLPSFDIVIPSSQSQEQELTIPTEKDMETGVKRYPIQRTIPGESFSVPIQDSILYNLLSGEQELETPAGNNLDSVDPGTLADSETEDEGLPNSFYEERTLDPNAARSFYPESSLGIGSYSSLPPEVWEFRKMFENGDESYPADFPESLRS